MVRVGDVAPDFKLPAQDGRTVSLHDFLGVRNVVLYFYPKDFTAGCTAETKTFSDNYDRLQELGAEVIGVSSDTSESHRDFAKECNARFVLLADREGSVRQAYGVRSSLGLVPGRTTFVIDKRGVVRHVYTSQLNPRRHATEAVEALKSMVD